MEKFDIIKRGYSKHQVDMTIENLESELEQTKSRLKVYQDRCDQLYQDKIELQTKIKELSINIHAKEKANEELTKIALSDANHMISCARNNADAIIKEAFMKAKIVLLEAAKLTTTTHELKDQIQVKVNELNALIKEMDRVPKIDANIE